MSKHSEELPEDIEVVGPGQMLRDAREAMKLSQSDVATKLNFRVTLVNDIESEIFDKTLPDTFNRGYLKNYAKLVGVAEQDVLSSYEMLGIAAKQRTEMQSFSKITEKQALNNRLMWITYLILAALVASTAVYYIQDVNQKKAAAIPSQAEVKEGELLDADSATQTDSATENLAENSEPSAEVLNEKNEEVSPQNFDSDSESQLNLAASASDMESASLTIDAQVASPDMPPEPLESTAIFTFAGDCWVNIYDGNDNRIAWGIKKTGYVMELKGVAPFQVTVGKPELVSIDFNGQSIDMSKFNEGNIAKFTLPESS